MKKEILFIILIVFTMFGFQAEDINSNETLQTIPDEAIRLRILANSDSDKDQHIKAHVRDEVNLYINDLVKHIDNIEEARRTIRDHVPELEKIVEKTLLDLNVSQAYSVEYSSNVAFPMKVYDNFVYPRGEYEAVLITIGEGKGANWWCVLFPPLCFLDFSNGSTVADSEEPIIQDEEEITSDEKPSLESEEETDQEEDEGIEVKFFLLEWLGLS